MPFDAMTSLTGGGGLSSSSSSEAGGDDSLGNGDFNYKSNSDGTGNNGLTGLLVVGGMIVIAIIAIAKN